MNTPDPSNPIAGQLNSAEREIISQSVSGAARKPQVVLEIGTWLGGGSTLHFLKALELNREGHLWGIEADRSIYEQMLENLRRAAPEAMHRFTPLFGFSESVIPNWLKEQGNGFSIDVAFLDGGDNPLEQVREFQLLADRIPVGGRLLAHDAKLRKGKWLHPYLSQFDNWSVKLHDVSSEGLLSAVKLKPHPTPASRRAAQRKLLILRLAPIELIGRLLPKRACDILLALLPDRLTKRITQGRK